MKKFFMLLFLSLFLVLPPLALSDNFADGNNPVVKKKKKKKKPVRKIIKKKRKASTIKKTELDINSVLPKVPVAKVYDWKPRLRFYISCYKGGKYAINVTDPVKDFTIVPNQIMVSDFDSTGKKPDERDVYIIINAIKSALMKYFKIENLGYNSGYFIARFPDKEKDFDLNELSHDIVMALKEYDAYEIFPRVGCPNPNFATSQP